MMNADSIKSKLRNLAQQANKPYDYLLMHFFIERLLYRLSISSYAKNFILKGGLLLYAMLENDARATRDVDFLAQRLDNTPEDLIGIFVNICAIEADDAIRFDTSTIRAARIKEDADYEGVRIKLTAYLDKSRQMLQFDIGYGDVIVPKPLDLDYPSLLNMERPRLKVYSMESVISEKFEAMIALADVNSRMKDFYDVYTLSRTHDFDGHILYEAIRQTLQRRGTPLVQTPIVFTDDFAGDKGKQTQWASFERRICATQVIPFENVLSRVKAFLAPIYASILLGDDFFGRWESASSEKWDLHKNYSNLESEIDNNEVE